MARTVPVALTVTPQKFRVPYQGFVASYRGLRGRITKQTGRNAWLTNAEGTRMFSLRSDGVWRAFGEPADAEGLDF